MKKSHLVGVTALLLSFFLGNVAPGQSQAAFENPKVIIVYGKTQKPALQPIAAQLQKYAVLEKFKQFLTPLKLPTNLTIQAAECGANTKPYKHGGPVTICYELINDFEAIIAQHADENDRPTLNAGAIIEALLHDVAYAIFDIYQVPIWGRIDDASDRVSAFIMLQFGEDLAVNTIVGTANLFLWSNKTWSGKDFASPDSPEAQRFYNYICIAYGSDPSLFAFLVKNNTLPQDRADRCKGEYEQVKKAFNLRVMPFIDPDLLVEAKAHFL